MSKTIYLPTNYNNKLACHCFIHIDLAPLGPVIESKIETTPIEIRTSDNSHPPVTVKLNDLLRLPLNDVAAIFTWPSHGMDKLGYISHLLLQKPNINNSTPMAVYFYKKINN